MKKAILVVSYGSTYPEAVHNAIEATEADIQAAFPAYDVRRAFTGDRIRKSLAAQGILSDSPAEALARLADDGYTSVFVQPTHIISGGEYEKIAAAVEACRDRFTQIALGTPLLHTTADIEAICRFFHSHYDQTGDALLIMGHGSDHPSNQLYSDFAQTARSLGFSNMHIATLEASPNLDDLIPHLQATGCHHVTITPLLFTAGGHACRDMAGDDETSWKSRLENAGFTVYPVVRGLGEYDDIRHLYVLHLQKLIDANP